MGMAPIILFTRGSKIISHVSKITNLGCNRCLLGEREEEREVKEEVEEEEEHRMHLVMMSAQQARKWSPFHLTAAVKASRRMENL